jgi:hypothetical protein
VVLTVRWIQRRKSVIMLRYKVSMAINNRGKLRVYGRASESSNTPIEMFKEKKPS